MIADRNWPLDAHVPGLAAVPRLSFAHTPTPVERLRLPDYLSSDNVWVKREDKISPLYGGNKVRRLELLLADARAKHAHHILTVGGLGSTQVQAIALFGRTAGFKVTAVLFDQPMSEFARQALAVSAAAGCELVYGGSYAMTALRTIGILLRERPYFIGPGAATPLANLGYVDAMYELAAQVERGELPRPDKIVLPTGSSGTLAALAIGCAMLDWPTEIVGVRITAAIACNRVTINFIIRRTLALLRKLGAPALQRTPRFCLVHDQLGAGYGHPTPAASQGAEQVAAFTGAPGEMTYSGKALAALRAVSAATPNENILFWHTLSSGAPTADPAALPSQFQRVLQKANAG